MKKTVCLLLAALMLPLSGCAVAEEKEIRIECQPVEGRSLQTEYVFPEEVFVGTPAPEAESECLKLAAYPNSGIDVYGVREGGKNEETLIVVWQDCARAFDVSYIGTGGIGLRSGVLDVNEDGQEELILIELVGTGTGVSVENLHIIEKSGGSLSLYSFTTDVYNVPMREWISGCIDTGDGNIQIGEKTFWVPENVGVTDFAFGNLVSFEMADTGIRMEADIQFWAKGEPFRGISEYDIELTAQVAFEDGAFTLNGFETAESSADAETSAEPAEYSYEGTVFSYGGRSYDLAARTEGITGILSAVPAGEKIVLECHVGPKNGIYCIFDTVDQTFEKEIAGNHFTWHSDDVTTAVYAFWSDIYTYDGTLVKSYPLAENEFIRSLRFSDDHTKLHVSIWQSNGTERTDIIPL